MTSNRPEKLGSVSPLNRQRRGPICAAENKGDFSGGFIIKHSTGRRERKKQKTKEVWENYFLLRR
jgi:hypothetical protein